MKQCSIIMYAAILALGFLSCKKTEVIKNNGIVGSWLLTEMYYGYANGGDFKWHAVDYKNSHTMTFTDDKKYREKDNSGNNPDCLGTYVVQSPTLLIVNSNCSTMPVDMNISELTPQILIIDMQGIEGKIRYKYLSVE